jgi:hypothetical protein
LVDNITFACGFISLFGYALMQDNFRSQRVKGTSMIVKPEQQKNQRKQHKTEKAKH